MLAAALPLHYSTEPLRERGMGERQPATLKAVAARGGSSTATENGFSLILKMAQFSITLIFESHTSRIRLIADALFLYHRRF